MGREEISEKIFERNYMIHGNLNSQRYVSDVLRYKRNADVYSEKNESLSEEQEEMAERLRVLADHVVPSSKRDQLGSAEEEIESRLEKINKQKEIPGRGNKLKNIGTVTIFIFFFGGLILLAPSMTGGAITGSSVSLESSSRNFFGGFLFILGLVGTFLLARKR